MGQIAVGTDGSKFDHAGARRSWSRSITIIRWATKAARHTGAGDTSKASADGAGGVQGAGYGGGAQPDGSSPSGGANASGQQPQMYSTDGLEAGPRMSFNRGVLCNTAGWC